MPEATGYYWTSVEAQLAELISGPLVKVMDAIKDPDHDFMGGGMAWINSPRMHGVERAIYRDSDGVFTLRATMDGMLRKAMGHSMVPKDLSPAVSINEEQIRLQEVGSDLNIHVKLPSDSSRANRLKDAMGRVTDMLASVTFAEGGQHLVMLPNNRHEYSLNFEGPEITLTLRDMNTGELGNLLEAMHQSLDVLHGQMPTLKIYHDHAHDIPVPHVNSVPQVAGNAAVKGKENPEKTRIDLGYGKAG